MRPQLRKSLSCARSVDFTGARRTQNPRSSANTAALFRIGTAEESGGRRKWLVYAAIWLLLGIFSPRLQAQTYIETTTKGPTSNSTCDATALTDSLLLSSAAGTATTKSVTLNANAFYAIGFTTASGVPGLTTWQPSTYKLAVDNSTTNANVQISDVCFARVDSTGASIAARCQAGTINTALSTAAVRTFNCQGTTSLTTAATDRLIGILLLKNTVGSRQSVTLRLNTANDAITVTPLAIPVINTVSPSSGTAGTAITISGSNFGATRGAGTVTVNGHAAAISAWADTSISATVPALTTTGNIVVTSGNGVASNVISFTIPAPGISNISPDSGRAGASVTVAGTNLGSVQGTISFNGVSATPSSWSNTQIVVPVPASATTGPVVVTQAGASNSLSFTVVPPPSISGIAPVSGPVNTSVTISGSGFGIPQGAGTVKFNGTAATPFSWSDGSIIAPVPAGATTGPVVVTAGGVNSNSITFTVAPGPGITSLSPSTGAAGTAVTIAGQNFGGSQGSSTVRFNSLPAAVTSWSATSIAVTVPNGVSTGPVTVTVSGLASNGSTFTAVTSGSLAGTVSSSADGSAISGATVQATQNGAVKGTATTTTGGTYTLANLPSGKYDITVTATGFGKTVQSAVAVTAGQTSTANFSLTAPGTISGTVTGPDGVTPISGATVQAYVGSAASNSATTDANGNYSISGLGAAAYSVQAIAAGYVTKSQTANLTAGGTTAANFSLQTVGANPIIYAYDELGRLIGVIDSSGDAVTYKYDAIGNMLAITRQSASQLSIIGFTPRNGAAGTTVTISGTAFSTTASQNTVLFNGTAATVVSATATQIVVTVPAGATTGPITVTTPSASVSSTSNFTVAANSGAPTITSFTPALGATGASVTITGTNFDVLANDKITFNTAHAAVTSATSTQIIATVPSNATSGHIALSTPSGQSTSTQDFYVPFGTHVVADVGFTGRISAGGSQTISLAANQIGLLLFDGISGQGASLQLSGSTFAGCTLYIYAPGGAQLTSSSCTSGTTFINSITEPVTGTYTIGIEPGANAGSITVGLTPDVSGSITAGTPLTVTTTAPGQNAHYTFNALAGQHASIGISNSSYAGCNGVVVSILKADGTSLGSTGLCNTGNGFLDSVALPAAGTYTVLVDPQGSATGSATLLLNVFNDVTGTITAGTTITATTTIAGQNALYTFTGSAGQQVALNVTGATFAGCLSFTTRILNPDGSTLASSSSCGSSAFIDSVTLGSNGVYTAVVDPQGTTTGSASVVLSTFADITGTITPGTPITVTTTTVGQNARYTFSGTAGQQISVNITNSTYSGCLSLTARVLNPDGSTLGSSSTCGNSLFVDSLTLGSSGTYTLVIDPQGTATGSASVVLNTFSDVTGTITAGAPITTTTSTAGQNALYTFSGTAGQQVSVNVTNSTYAGCLSLSARVLNPDGSTLGSSSTCGSTLFVDSLTLGSTGTYTVVIDPQGTATGSATVLLSTFSDIVGTITPGTPITVTTTAAGQNARYTFSGTSGQQVSINLSNSTYAGCSGVTVSILKPDGSSLGSSGTCNSSSGFLDSLTLPAAGTYTVSVNPQGTSTGSVTVLLNTFADVTGTVTQGTPITVTTTVPGQNALYTFTGTSGQQVSVNLSNSTYTGCNSVMVGILKPDGTSLGSAGICNSTSGSLNTLTLPSAGTYTLFIDPQGATTGSLTAVLNNFADVSGTITPGTAVTITTTVSGQNARYTFSGTAGQQVSLTLTSSSYTGCNAVLVSILKPDGTTLGSTGLCNTSSGFLDSLTLPTTGTYTVFVDPQGTVTGSITVLLNTFADVTGTIAPGTAVTATTTTAGQNALYTFSGTAGQQVSVNLSSSTYTGCNAVLVSILKPDNSNLGSTGICNGSSGFLDSLTLPTTGTYTVKVDPQGAATGNITLLLNTFADVTGTITPGTALTATTSSAGQNALYTFSGTSGQQVSITLSNSTYTGCNAVVVSILKPDNSNLGSTGICNGNSGFLDSLTLPTTGTYTVKVDPQGTTTGNITLLLNNFADVTGTITPGTPITATTTSAGQNALYTFSGTSGQQVSITLSNSTYTGCNAVVVSILKPDNSNLGSTGICNGSSGFLDSLTLPTTGTYTVMINPQGTGAGSITVLLNTFADVTGAIAAGTSLTATTTVAGQNALYTFSGTSGQQVSVNISGSSYAGCNAVVVSILKPDGSSLGSTGLCNTTSGFLDSLTLPTTGTYTVKVDPQGTTTGSVTVLMNSFADVTGTITSGTAVTATTTTPGQNALYTFSGTSGQSASVSVTGSTYTGCNAMVVSILKPDGSSLGSSGLCNTSTGSLGPLTLPTTGTYTVFVNPQGAVTGSATVTLTLQ